MLRQPYFFKCLIQSFHGLVHIFLISDFNPAHSTMNAE